MEDCKRILLKLEEAEELATGNGVRARLTYSTSLLNTLDAISSAEGKSNDQVRY